MVPDFTNIGAKPLKAFTVAEMLVSLVLISVSVTMGYHSLAYTRRMFQLSKTQNHFIQQYSSFKQTLNYQNLKSSKLVEERENEFCFYADSFSTRFIISESALILLKGARTDSLPTKAFNIVKTYEAMLNPMWQNKLINSLSFQINFNKQVFNFSIRKQHDASVKLELEKQI